MDLHRLDKKDETFYMYKDGMRVKITANDMKQIHRVKKILRENKINTVCEKARCPNMPECFLKSTATFIILGKNCTRNCAFCAVSSAKPQPVNPEESQNVASAVRMLNLKHVVITSVTRDDLPDRGVSQFIDSVKAVKCTSPDTTIELLTPDFEGVSDETMLTLLDEGIDIFGHNMEMPEKFYSSLRPKSDYKRSLELLKRVKWLKGNVKTKSAIMLGIGEETNDVLQLIEDIRSADCDIIVIGQYLQPTTKNIKIQRLVKPVEFKFYEEFCKKLGFEKVFSFAKARSSYSA